MDVLVKKLSSLVFLGLCLALLMAPQSVLAFSFDFSGTVLFDSKASAGYLPGFGDSFKGSLSMEDDALGFMNTIKSTFYENLGDVTGGYFKQNNQDFFYAFSQGTEATSQMGMIWWSESRNFTINGRFFGDVNGSGGVYGLVFYVEGSTLYTPAQMIAWRVVEYMATGVLPTLTGGTENPHYVGCQVLAGEAFFGVIQTPFVADQSSSAVPLPASVWFLGSGFLFLVRRRKR